MIFEGSDPAVLDMKSAVIAIIGAGEGPGDIKRMRSGWSGAGGLDIEDQKLCPAERVGVGIWVDVFHGWETNEGRAKIP